MLATTYAAPEPKDVRRLELRCYSYEERREVLAAVAEVVSSGGCWLKGRKALSFTQVEFLFEMQLRVALDVYSALLQAGLELAPQAHSELTSLCTLRRHKDHLQADAPQIVSVRLELHFIDDAEPDFGLGSGGLA
jgi:glycine cleavage system regulatory protein